MVEPWMLREMREQPEALAATFARYADDSGWKESAVAPVRAWLAGKKQIIIAASGSSRHAGLLAEVLIEEVSGLAVDVEYASEYVYWSGARAGRVEPGAGVVVISQSGETADTLAALRKAKELGRATLAVTNVAGSSMVEEADAAMLVEAGRERAVPATKSFTGQCLVLSMLALLAAEGEGSLTPEQVKARLRELGELPARVAAQLAGWEAQTRTLAERYLGVASMLFLGRGVHAPIAREGALKLKESAYVHAEGYPSGELKHGPNALVSEAMPLLMLATVDEADEASRVRYEKTMQLMRDMRDQGAAIVAVANEGDAEVAALADGVVSVAAGGESVLAICEVIPLQMFAYFVATGRGIDVDRPRNLVKAVVAE